MCVYHSQQHPWTNTGIILYLLTIFLVNFGSFSCKINIKHSQSFFNLKHWSRKSLERRLKLWGGDNGGEYVSNEFKNFCVEEGIKWELMTPHNPQQNGIAKRKNKRIVGEAWVMLYDQGLPLHFWVEACNTTIYLQNKVWHHILGMSWMKEPHQCT